MDTQTNGHSKTKNAVRKGTRKASPAVSNVEDVIDRAEHIVKHGVSVIEHSAAGGWVSKNPKKAVGIALGTGLIVGSFLDGKYLRAAAVGTIGLLVKRYF